MIYCQTSNYFCQLIGWLVFGIFLIVKGSFLQTVAEGREYDSLPLTELQHTMDRVIINIPILKVAQTGIVMAILLTILLIGYRFCLPC